VTKEELKTLGLMGVAGALGYQIGRYPLGPYTPVDGNERKEPEEDDPDFPDDLNFEETARYQEPVVQIVRSQTQTPPPRGSIIGYNKRRRGSEEYKAFRWADSGREADLENGIEKYDPADEPRIAARLRLLNKAHRLKKEAYEAKLARLAERAEETAGRSPGVFSPTSVHEASLAAANVPRGRKKARTGDGQKGQGGVHSMFASPEMSDAVSYGALATVAAGTYYLDRKRREKERRLRQEEEERQEIIARVANERKLAQKPRAKGASESYVDQDGDFLDLTFEDIEDGGMPSPALSPIQSTTALERANLIPPGTVEERREWMSHPRNMEKIGLLDPRHGWICPNCEDENRGRVCGSCGTVTSHGIEHKF
jgi:hypothetical protein